MIYRTTRGDTWDSIAYKTLGDEFLMDDIMEINRKYADYIIFDGGENITIPEMVEKNGVIITASEAKNSVVSVISAPWG
jgi:phage tail protein X